VEPEGVGDSVGRLSLHGDTPPANVSSVLFVGNHVSWLDSLVINACRRVRFVAKGEVRRWSLIGWLAARTGTVFLKRGSSRGLAGVAKRMRAILRRGQCVACFPEGTTTNSKSVNTFHSGLFESAVQAEALLWPIAIQYVRDDGVIDRASHLWETSRSSRRSRSSSVVPPYTPDSCLPARSRAQPETGIRWRPGARKRSRAV
jgi:1-acyl-sn-glycerol-3-phosphate acyltransferase